MKLENLRTGIGYDTHLLVQGNKIIMGGESINHYKKIVAHSDGDVLIHSIIDALLGAIGEGDIGRHFPDSDPIYKNISSIKLLKTVNSIIKRKAFRIINIDAVIIAEKPKFSKFIDKMRTNISQALNIAINNINIKATTAEGKDAIGREEAISVYSIVLGYFE